MVLRTDQQKKREILLTLDPVTTWVVTRSGS